MKINHRYLNTETRDNNGVCCVDARRLAKRNLVNHVASDFSELETDPHKRTAAAANRKPSQSVWVCVAGLSNYERS